MTVKEVIDSLTPYEKKLLYDILKKAEESYQQKKFVNTLTNEYMDECRFGDDERAFIRAIVDKTLREGFEWVK